MILWALLIALLVYLPFGYAARPPCSAGGGLSGSTVELQATVMYLAFILAATVGLTVRTL